MNKGLKALCCAAAACLAVAACAAPASASTAAYDAAGRIIAKKLRAGPPQNPPRTIKRHVIDGKTFYYVRAPCCDQFNDLYDARGQRLCSPDGGITGRGDGRCAEIRIDPREGDVVWQDAR